MPVPPSMATKSLRIQPEASDPPLHACALHRSSMLGISVSKYQSQNTNLKIQSQQLSVKISGSGLSLVAIVNINIDVLWTSFSIERPGGSPGASSLSRRDGGRNASGWRGGSTVLWPRRSAILKQTMPSTNSAAQRPRASRSPEEPASAYRQFAGPILNARFGSTRSILGRKYRSSQKGGKRVYKGHHGKDRSPGESCHFHREREIVLSRS
jgi:hypothetical protein